MPTADGSIFPACDRGLHPDVPWTASLGVLTPVQQGDSGRWYKREDWFAPLGYGGINGSKLRQLLILARRHEWALGMVTAASVKSPQIPMGALVAAHMRQECHIILGATNPDSAAKHETVRIALAAGASLGFIPVAYNPQLQQAARAEALARGPEWWRLCYGITTPDDDPFEYVADFHLPGAAQVANLPPVETLYISAGSCNTLTTVLAGIMLNRPPKLRRVVAIGIGPDRLPWCWARLTDVARFTGRWPSPEERFVYQRLPSPGFLIPNLDDRVVIEHVDLHAAGVYSYTDLEPATADGIELHPTYEGKVHTWLEGPGRTLFPGYAAGEGCLWIVGSRPSLAPMKEYLDA